jgi:hypothetical protein
VVLPEPKNPVRMVAGIKAMEILQKRGEAKIKTGSKCTHLPNHLSG